MDKIIGTNLGNWLVLEKWMSPFLFEGTDAEDETWLARLLPHDELARRMKEHRENYVTEEDFRQIASHGMNLVRIPVPYFIFGDREPFIGCVEELDKAFRPETKCVFGETISNPGGHVFDIERFARLAHEHGVPLIVDNTFATPVHCRPFEWGADIVTHSTTKYMDGHAATVGGCVVDSGNFDWMAHAERFPGLCAPDESYHGLTYAAFGKNAYITKATAQLMRDMGAIQSPQNAFLLNQGLETLHLRMRRHCENAQRVAEFLQADPRVAWVNYAGLPGDKYYELGRKYLPQGGCGVIAFGLKGTREEAIRFMDSLRMICIVTHVADARTCVLHPASHTHRQLSDEQLREAGIAPDLIRLSVGIEDVADILADISQALDRIGA